MARASISGDSEIAGDALALLEALPEAMLVVSPGGTVMACNAPARRLFGGDVGQRSLAALHHGDAKELERFLKRCRGTSTPLIGTLALRGGGKAERQKEKYRLRGTRLSLAGGASVLLRIDRQDEERFAEFTRKVSALDLEIRERKHTEAVLAEALEERELLLRELQHRVKNNVHMLQGLLQGAQREAESAEAKHALRNVSLRVGAINAVQQLLYSSASLESIGSQPLAKAVADAALALAEQPIASRLEVEPFDIPIHIAVPLALVMNELLTNAVKYGQPQKGRQRVTLKMAADEDWVELLVQDNGPGFTLRADRKRSSGTGLVRGLVRQLGGSFETDGKEGTRCLVRFRLPQQASGALNA